jgi:hypothetical protein
MCIFGVRVCGLFFFGLVIKGKRNKVGVLKKNGKKKKEMKIYQP